MYGEMDEEMEDLVVHHLEVSEFDIDYEFDAARFFDFARPESSSEAEEAERWFESAGSYPPSPFIIKLKWREDIAVDNANASFKSNDIGSMICSGNNLDCDMDPEVFVLDNNKKGPKFPNNVAQGISKMKTKSVAQSSKITSSTLMKPTASHLAKLNPAREVHSSRLLGRSQKLLTKTNERNSRNAFGVDSNATKRQRLENGYLCKVAHLKHQNLLLHKISNVRRFDALTVNSRLKVTIPREPNLETAHRAQKHRSRNNSELGEHEKPKARTFKARPMNKKILNAPSLPLQRSRPQYPVFHLKTSERDMQHSSTNDSESLSENGTTDTERLNIENASKLKKSNTFQKVKDRLLSKKTVPRKKDVGTCKNVDREARVPVELKLPDENRLSYNPPIELFSKMSLKSEIQHNAISQTKLPLHPKGSKENVPSSFKSELLVS